jgi:hypothetical protein
VTGSAIGSKLSPLCSTSFNLFFESKSTRRGNGQRSSAGRLSLVEKQAAAGWGSRNGEIAIRQMRLINRQEELAPAHWQGKLHHLQLSEESAATHSRAPLGFFESLVSFTFRASKWRIIGPDTNKKEHGMATVER